MRNPIADIYKQGVLAGHFYRDAQTTSFLYSPAYLEAEGQAVASTLPLTDKPLVQQAGALPPFFTGLLPEGRRLTALRNQLKVSRDDELSMLLALGVDTVGDVQILPHGAKLPEDRTLSSLTSLEEISFENATFSELLSQESFLDTASLAGVQEKVSGRMLTLPLRQENDLYLLKLNPPEYPYLVENEHFFLTQARKIGARTGVASSRLVKDKEGCSGLLIRRFDRGVDEQGKILRFPVEDACQLLNRYPADKYNLSTTEVGQALIGLAKNRILTAQEVMRQLIYAWLTGNGDLHAKNISLIDYGSGWELSPLYDLPSTAPYGDQTLALPLQGKRSGLSGKTFVEQGQQLGLKEAATQRLIRQVLKSTESIEDLSEEIPFDSSRRKRLQKVLKNRRLTLSAGI